MEIGPPVVPGEARKISSTIPCGNASLRRLTEKIQEHPVRPVLGGSDAPAEPHGIFLRITLRMRFVLGSERRLGKIPLFPEFRQIRLTENTNGTPLEKHRHIGTQTQPPECRLSGQQKPVRETFDVRPSLFRGHAREKDPREGIASLGVLTEKCKDSSSSMASSPTTATVRPQAIPAKTRHPTNRTNPNDSRTFPPTRVPPSASDMKQGRFRKHAETTLCRGHANRTRQKSHGISVLSANRTTSRSVSPPEFRRLLIRREKHVVFLSEGKMKFLFVNVY